MASNQVSISIKVLFSINGKASTSFRLLEIIKPPLIRRRLCKTYLFNPFLIAVIFLYVFIHIHLDEKYSTFDLEEGHKSKKDANDIQG